MDNNNKYLFDIDTLSEQEIKQARDLRRRKHKQGQIIAWVVLVAAVLILGTGLFFAGRGLAKHFFGTGEKTKVSDDADVTEPGGEDDSVIEDLLGEEEIVSVPPTEPEDDTPTESDLLKRQFAITFAP